MLYWKFATKVDQVGKSPTLSYQVEPRRSSEEGEEMGAPSDDSHVRN